MKTVKVGLVGAGQIAYGHCRGINNHPNAECIAVADPNEKRLKAIAKEFGIKNTYSSAEELFANADVDAVSIAVPNAFHAPVAISALKAKKHVMLDKPFALNVKEAKQVVAAAKKARKIFTLGMNQRFTPNSQTIRAVAQRGDLGDLYHGKAFWFRRSGIPKFGTWFCQKKLSGGGAMLDIGVHMLDLCLYVMDNFKPEAVSGATYTKFGNRGIGEGGWGMSDPGKHIFDVDDFSTGLIKLKGGATVGLDVSWAIHQEEASRNNVQVFGTEGGASVWPSKVFRYNKKRKKEYEVVEPQNVAVAHPAHCRFANWIDAIIKKDKLCCSVEQALAVQKILDAIYLSSKTGKEVRIK